MFSRTIGWIFLMLVLGEICYHIGLPSYGVALHLACAGLALMVISDIVMSIMYPAKVFNWDYARLPHDEVKPLYTQKVVDNAGFVYVLKALHDDTLFKIGHTKNPNDRVATFKNKLPIMVDYLILVQTSDRLKLETELHKRYKDKRQGGEWFKLTPDDLEYIRTL